MAKLCAVLGHLPQSVLCSVKEYSILLPLRRMLPVCWTLCIRDQDSSTASGCITMARRLRDFGVSLRCSLPRFLASCGPSADVASADCTATLAQQSVLRCRRSMRLASRCRHATTGSDAQAGIHALAASSASTSNRAWHWYEKNQTARRRERHTGLDMPAEDETDPPPALELGLPNVTVGFSDAATGCKERTSVSSEGAFLSRASSIGRG